MRPVSLIVLRQYICIYRVNRRSVAISSVDLEQDFNKMIANIVTFVTLLVVGATLAIPISQEPDDRSRLPSNHSSFKKRLDVSKLSSEIPENIFNKLYDSDVQEQLENAIGFLQNNADLLEFADKADAEGIFQGIDNIMRKVMDAAKETISEENKSIHDSAVSLTDAGKQILETGTQLGKTGVDLTLMLPKFGFNILRQGKK